MYHSFVQTNRASIKLFELDVRTPGNLFLGIRYAGAIDYWRFCTPCLPIFSVILGILEAKKMYKLFYCILIIE